VQGRLERRDGALNLIARRVVALAPPPAPAAEPVELDRLRAAAPNANSFGRGRR
jgi:hypothetical protein